MKTFYMRIYIFISWNLQSFFRNWNRFCREYLGRFIFMYLHFYIFIGLLLHIYTLIFRFSTIAKKLSWERQGLRRGKYQTQRRANIESQTRPVKAGSRQVPVNSGLIDILTGNLQYRYIHRHLRYIPYKL